MADQKWKLVTHNAPHFKKFRVSTSVADRRWKYVTHRARPMAVSHAATVVMVMDIKMPYRVVVCRLRTFKTRGCGF